MTDHFEIDRDAVGKALADELPLVLRALQLWLVQLQNTIAKLEGDEHPSEKAQSYLRAHEQERTRLLDLVAEITASVAGKKREDLTRDDVAAARRFIAETWPTDTDKD
ncbi:hypothetical protein FEZ32_05410 [Acidipropionibacterium jensenii]|uniref:hypothetical protein n=1 Tax=Acidipropionibacterium jensenii TaxID=1749 RepID=UPI00110BDB42|nr:hypothetical protein [Acidipropionibacterium jensenii]QCV87875.1 hypothetical protein FEZ32_05410 [Acidipropionibacterium jensenii]